MNKSIGRSKKFIYNTLATTTLEVATMLAGFIIPRIMLTIYGSEVFGLVTSVSQFIAYFNLVEAGLASAAVYSLYKPLAENDNAGINAILSAARRFYNKSGYIFISLVLGLATFYPFFIESMSVSTMEMRILVFLIGCSGIGCSGAFEFFIMAKYRVLLTADQKLYVLSIASVCSIILNTILIAVLAHYRVNIVVLRTVTLCGVFLRSVILHIYLKRNYRYVNFHTKPNNDAMKKRWDALYLQILGSTHKGTPVIIATIFTDLKTVSVYSVYNIAFAGISGVLSIVVKGLFASFGDVIARKQQDILQRAYQEFELIYYMFITWVYSCSAVLIVPFIKVYTQGVTDINYFLPYLGILFTLKGLIHNIKTPQGMLVISAGLFKETRVQTTLQGIIAVVGSIVLVQFWGLPGILLGTILSDFYRDIDLLFFIPRNVTKLKVRDSFYRIIRIFVCFGLVLASFSFVRIDATNYLEWVSNAVLVGIYTLIVVVVVNFIFEGKVFTRAIKRLSTVLSKK